MDLNKRLDNLVARHGSRFIKVRLKDGGEWLLTQQELLSLLCDCIEIATKNTGDLPGNPNIEKLKQVKEGQNKTLDVCRGLVLEVE